eukprot:c40807_g1_i1 orf=150-305(+)
MRSCDRQCIYSLPIQHDIPSLLRCKRSLKQIPTIFPLCELRHPKEVLDKFP